MNHTGQVFVRTVLTRQGVKVVDEPDSLKYPMPLPLSITGEVR